MVVTRRPDGLRLGPNKFGTLLTTKNGRKLGLSQLCVMVPGGAYQRTGASDAVAVMGVAAVMAAITHLNNQRKSFACTCDMIVSCLYCVCTYVHTCSHTFYSVGGGIGGDVSGSGGQRRWWWAMVPVSFVGSAAVVQWTVSFASSAAVVASGHW